VARNIIADLLQNHRFWLLDLVPSATYPFFVLGSPAYGFQACSMPEFTFETREVKQLNSMLKRTVYEGGGWGTVTLTRGVRCTDDTFYEWVRRAIDGLDTIDRHLLLVQFAPASLVGGNSSILDALPAIQAGLGAVGNPSAAIMGAFAGAMDSGYMANVPGKAWLLWGCVPVRYKPGSDLDATDAGISLMELELAVFSAAEFSLLSTL
jgi:hypothetical protein